MLRKLLTVSLLAVCLSLPMLSGCVWIQRREDSSARLTPPPAERLALRE